MSYGVQNLVPVSIVESSLFTTEGEDSCETQAEKSASTEEQGMLKSNVSKHVVTTKPNLSTAQEIRSYLHTFSSKLGYKTTSQEKSTPMDTISSTLRSQKSDSLPTILRSKTNDHTDGKKTLESRSSSQSDLPSHQKASNTETAPTHQPILNKSQTEGFQKTTHKESPQEKKLDKRDLSSPLSERPWKKEITKHWWETRYHQKERQGDQQRGGQHQNQEKKEERARISKTAGISSGNTSSDNHHSNKGQTQVKKPTLAPPRIGVFALYYILTKIGLLSDGSSNFIYKKEVELIDLETTETHRKRLDELKEAIKKEKETEQWGVSMKVFSWIASIIAVISGIILIATGIGTVAGALLIVGGIIQVSSQIMELAGGWQKVAALLPGDDSEKKRAVIQWMQIGIAVLCLVLSGAGILYGGFSNFGKAMQTATALLGAIAAMGTGITTIGEGVSGFMFKERLSKVKHYDLNLAKLKHNRLDLMEKVESGIGRLERLFEDLARSLEFEEELFQADQSVNRR